MMPTFMETPFIQGFISEDTEDISELELPGL